MTRITADLSGFFSHFCHLDGGEITLETP